VVYENNNLRTCGIGQKTDFWTITNPVELNTIFADEIHVDVEAELTLCLNPGNNARLPCIQTTLKYTFIVKPVIKKMYIDPMILT
jgi:hypothetical protein